MKDRIGFFILLNWGEMGMVEGAFESFNDEREMAARWQKLRKSGTMNSLGKEFLP